MHQRQHLVIIPDFSNTFLVVRQITETLEMTTFDK